MTLTVSRLASRVGLSPDTVRYYERIGLLHLPPRTAGGYRIYGDDAIERLQFVKSAQRLGLKLDEIKELLQIRDQGLCPCGHADVLITQRVAELDEEIKRLTVLRDELQRMVATRSTEGECIREFFEAEASRPEPVAPPVRRNLARSNGTTDRPSSVGPSSVGPSKIGPSKIGPSKIGPSKIGPSKIGKED